MSLEQTTTTCLVQNQRAFFHSGQTQSLDFRREQLQRLRQAIVTYEEAIVAAVKADLGRSDLEAYIERSPLVEIRLALRQIKAWMRPRRVPTPWDQWPASAWVQPEPLGVVLIIGPWNYPFQLVISPLVGAIAAGNCAILKPSELAPHTAQVVSDLIAATFEPGYITTVTGGAEASQCLLAEKFDHIFFTGASQVGRIVMAAAAEHLTPVTLELGGKSPCIVDTDVDLGCTVRRIVWGKFLNAGQTCIAPDYVLVQESMKPALLEQMQRTLESFYGPDPATSPDYARIVNNFHFERLVALLTTGKIVVGGQTDSQHRYIAPTILDEVGWEDDIMATEIFGPILPILTYQHLDEAIARINARPKPLALYLFSRDRRKQRQVLQRTSSGTVCFNHTVMQVITWELPFGGVGSSGMGRYRGKAGFDTFSNAKSILRRSFWLDLPFIYPPYHKGIVEIMKRIMMR